VVSDPVTHAVVDGVAVITMDDGKANAVSPALQAGVNAALDSPTGHGLPVVLTGRPGFFSAGFDLKVLAAGGQPAVDMLHGGISLAMRLLSHPMPVVVASPGHAIAMGVFLSLCGDYRIGARGPFRYVANEVAIGMAMPFSTIELLRQRVTPAALPRAVLLAEVFTPDNAVANGLLDETAEPDNLLPRAVEFARSLASLDSHAHAASKKRLRAPLLSAMRDGLERDLEGWQKQFLA
jgi:enoyl-CoA hydratase